MTNSDLTRRFPSGVNASGSASAEGAQRAPSLIDSFGRTIDYLRISVTDRCNFRCVYCMPPEGIPNLSHNDVLTFEEIARIARIFLQMGGKRLRITGGEPLVRKNIIELVFQLSNLPGLESLGLTTNGFYLKEFAKFLKEAGLKKINVSLDSVRPSRFSELTHCPQGVNASGSASAEGGQRAPSSFEKVWEGIEEALFVGLQTKINVVALKGISEEEILSFGEMAKRLPVEVRFIEFMPLCGTGWHPEWMIPLREIRNALNSNFELLPLPRGTEVAESYQVKKGRGRIGFISSMTEPFCKNCSRLRLTCDGKIRPCLFSNLEIDLKSWLRGGWPDTDIMATILEAVRAKPSGHHITFPIPDARELPRIRFIGG